MSNTKFRTSGKNSKEDDLFEAVKIGKLIEVQELIENQNVKANCLDEDERTPLHWAAAKGQISVAQYLLNKEDLGVTPNTKDDGGWTPLSSATSAGHTHMVKLLLEFKADPNCTNDSKRTPLHYASSKGRSDIVDLLLTSGAVIRKDDTGSSPLHRAAASGSVPTVERILKAGANINSTNNEGDTPLHIATEYNHEDLVECLLKNGADTTIENRDSKTPIDMTTSSSIKYLIKEFKK